MTHPLPDRLAPHGIVFDLKANTLPLDKWSAGRNVYFKAGETLRTQGEGPFGIAVAGVEPRYIHFVDKGTVSYWIFASDGGIGVTDGTSSWDLTPDAGAWGPVIDLKKKITLGDINTVPFVNHPERGPFYWDGDVTHKFVKLPGWDANWSCNAMRAHKNYLIALGMDLGTGNFEMGGKWSVSATPGTVPATWVPSPTNDAGDFSFGTPGGPLLDGISVRDQFFVCKSNFTGALQYVGGQYIFMTRDVFPSTGVFSTGAMTEKGGMVWMMTGAMQVVMHDGNQISNVSLGSFEDYLRDVVNMQFPSSVFVYRDDSEGQVYIAYPTTSDKACTEAISLEVATSDIGVRDLPSIYSAADGVTNIRVASWDGDPEPWDSDDTVWNQNATGYLPIHTVFGSASSMLETGAQADFADGPLPCFVERTGLDLGEYRQNKTISNCWPETTGTPDTQLQMSFTGQAATGEAIDDVDALPFAANRPGRVDVFIDGFYLGFSLSSDGGDPWKFSGMRLAVRRSGLAWLDSGT